MTHPTANPHHVIFSIMSIGTTNHTNINTPTTIQIAPDTTFNLLEPSSENIGSKTNATPVNAHPNPNAAHKKFISASSGNIA